MVDGSTGGFESGFIGDGQTREHAQLARSLGVEQLAVVVTKLDSVDYSKVCGCMHVCVHMRVWVHMHAKRVQRFKARVWRVGERGCSSAVSFELPFTTGTPFLHATPPGAF